MKNVEESADHRLLAYAVDFAGNEKFTLRVIDLSRKGGTTDRHLPDQIENTNGEIVWHQRLNGFFYAPNNAFWRQDRVMFHRIGSDPAAEDLPIYYESDPKYPVSIALSESKKFLFIGLRGSDNNEWHHLPMDVLDLKGGGKSTF